MCVPFGVLMHSPVSTAQPRSMGSAPLHGARDPSSCDRAPRKETREPPNRIQERTTTAAWRTIGLALAPIALLRRDAAGMTKELRRGRRHR